MGVDAVRDFFPTLQKDVVAALEAVDGAPFKVDTWTRPEGGGGTSCILEDGALFERGGVNYSSVKGSTLPPSATANRPQLAGQPWEAMGVSLVLHPRNP